MALTFTIKNDVTNSGNNVFLHLELGEYLYHLNNNSNIDTSFLINFDPYADTAIDRKEVIQLKRI